jgi:hypothetical protein
MGPPMSKREGCESVDTIQLLNSHVQGVVDLLGRVYDTLPDELERAQTDLQYVLNLPINNHRALACKRALVLTAMHLEREVAEHFEDDERRTDGGRMARDLTERVIPFLLPVYVRDMCQSPERFVLLAVVLSTLFAGERLGSFPTDGSMS